MDGNTRAVRILGLTSAPGATAPGALLIPETARNLEAGGRKPGLLVGTGTAARLAQPKPAKLLAAALVFSIFQFYVVPIGGFYASLGLLSAYGLVLHVDWSRSLVHPLAKLFLALLLAETASLSWSPVVFQGVRDIIFTAPFLIAFLAGRSVAERDERIILRCMKFFVLCACLHSALIIMMALSPGLKTLVFASPAGRLFMNPNAVNALMSGAATSNISDPTKSGGFVGNGNVAGAWAATALFATVAIMGRSRSIGWKLVALLHAAAIVACGSKAGLGLLLLTPLVVMAGFAIFPPPGKRRSTLVLVGLVLLLLGLVVAAMSPIVHARFFAATSFTLASREAIWSHAWDEFQRTPLLGLGYGGWAISFGKVGYAYAYLGIDGTFPQHNALIILWTQSGLPALLLGLAIIATLVRAAAAPRISAEGKRLAMGASGAYFFVTTQSMGENFGLFGDPHIQIPLAVLLGWASTYQTRYRPGKR